MSLVTWIFYFVFGFLVFLGINLLKERYSFTKIQSLVFSLFFVLIVAGVSARIGLNNFNENIFLILVFKFIIELFYNMYFLENDFFNKEDSNVLINVLIKGNNNKCDINYHVISENGYSKSKVSVKANKNTFGNVITENLKGLKEGGNILIEPILEIDTNEVEASHFVTIGTYDEESLLYLNSLGIKENDAKKLLKKSFMLSIFDDNFKKEVNYE